MVLVVEMWKRYFLTTAWALVMVKKLPYSYLLIWQVIYNLL